MPRAGFFAQLGMFVVPGFFDAALCASLRREMQSATTLPARILDSRNQIRVDEEQRRTEVPQVSDETKALVMARLVEIRPSVDRKLGIALEGCQPLSFLIYREGYSFGRHSDISPDPDAPLWIRQRRVSVSIFLNGEGEANVPDTYAGGSLTFYGGTRDPGEAGAPGLALTGEEGLLIGFRSDWRHSVQTVTRGVRYSIVTWFT